MNDDEQFQMPADGKRLALIAKRIFKGAIALLTFGALVLILQVGETWWHPWAVEHRQQILGFVLLALFLLIVLFPLAIEVTANPRPLSGPGRNPKLPPPPPI